MVTAIVLMNVRNDRINQVAQELVGLDGIGPVMAAAIADYLRDRIAEQLGVTVDYQYPETTVEEYERARSRKARIYAEVIGYHTAGSGDHVSQSNTASMIRCLEGALASADISADGIDYSTAAGGC